MTTRFALGRKALYTLMTDMNEFLSSHFFERCHFREGGNPDPENSRFQNIFFNRILSVWTPAFAGMKSCVQNVLLLNLTPTPFSIKLCVIAQRRHSAKRVVLAMRRHSSGASFR
jgi:hypothetical protein